MSKNWCSVCLGKVDMLFLLDKVSPVLFMVDPASSDVHNILFVRREKDELVFSMVEFATAVRTDVVDCC